MTQTAPGWYADPSGRHQMRYWDGASWTAHVTDNGSQTTDPMPPAPPGAVASVGTPPPSGYGPVVDLLAQRTLVISQRAKLIELTNEFKIMDPNGAQIGTIRQEGQSALKKAARFVASLDQFMTHTLAVYDASGQKVCELVRPRKIMKSKLQVSNGVGQPVGAIVQENMIGKINFALQDTAGQRVGTIKAENWRAWNFRIEDPAGQEVARITKTWEGLAETMFTTADNYAVQIHYDLPQTIRYLVLASAAGIDTALKQDSRGIG